MNRPSLCLAMLILAGIGVSQTVRFESVPRDFAPMVQAFKIDHPRLVASGGQGVEVQRNSKLKEEEFRIRVGDSVHLEAATPVGAAWGLQSLAEMLMDGRVRPTSDAPEYAFRTVMIDVARRYHSPSTLRRIVRWCQLGRVRFIQLHLTDDQNWMLPSKTLAGIDQRNTHKRPTYTEQELKDLQAYAEARGVSIIPEIDLPGHSTLLVQHNPSVFQIQGSASTNCVNFGSPEVRSILRSVVAEILALFPKAPYIHLGGDEAWYPDAEKDPHMAAEMKRIGAGPHEVFVDFISELSEQVLAAGRTPLVWEGFGPTEYAKKRFPKGGVVVAWEGDYYAADRLQKDGFTIVNAGWDPGYVVNHYPYDAFTLVPLERMLRWNPEQFGLVSWDPAGPPRQTKIAPPLGGLMCWWEGHEWNAQVVLPERILAFGSRLWNSKAKPRYEAWLTTARKRLAEVDQSSFPFKVEVSGTHETAPRSFVQSAKVRVKPNSTGHRIAMRSDGRTPELGDLKSEITVGESSVVTIQAFREGKPVGETMYLRLAKAPFTSHLAIGKSVVVEGDRDPHFGGSLLTDGVADDQASFWLGYPAPQTVTLDLGRAQQITAVQVVPFHASSQGVEFEIEFSADGKRWSEPTRAGSRDVSAEGHTIVADLSARYVRVRFLRSHLFPAPIPRIHEIRVIGR